MKGLRRLFDRLAPSFGEGGRLQALYPLYEVLETFLWSTGRRTRGAPHVRDALDLKRVMTIVLVALAPCVAMAFWNTGHEANLALRGAELPPGWRSAVLGLVGTDPGSVLACCVHGALYFVPLYLVSFAVGVFWEVVFACARRHTVSEGMFVTSLLFPLTLPPGIPLWQAALGMSFGTVVAKELFGGTGRNFMNPALAGRAFLYFAYPKEQSGDTVWTAVDGFTRATPLTAVPGGGMQAIDVTWSEAFLGTIPGSLGETSTLACLLGAAVLVGTGIGSWRVMLSMTLGAAATATLLVVAGSATNPMFAMGPEWHLVLGGFAFGCVFMATDPVSSAQTDPGRWIYGFLCGTLTILIRVVNPAYPEGVMLAILLGNVFAPLIDWCVVRRAVRRRLARHA